MIMQMIIAATPAMVDTARPAFLRYTKKPKRTAIRINRIEIIAVRAFAVLAAISTAPVSVKVALNVFATIEANAATTKISVR